MTRPLLVILLSFSFCQLLANGVDSTLYTTHFESQVFENIENSLEVDPFDLFACLDYDLEKYESSKSEINKIEESLIAQGIEAKSIKKKVKLIYKSVHDELLKKYSEDAFFYDFVESGEYNCVTASAIYAIILTRFEIDFEIKERPQHVYLIVNPLSDAIIMESTNPSRGVLIIDERAKRDYIKYLRSNKIISEEEYEKRSIDDLFNEYYNEDKSINVYQLAGLHYYNKGVTLSTKELFEKAANYYEKALTLYPKSELLRYNYNQSLVQLVSDNFTKKIYDGRTLGRYINLNSASKESMDAALNQFKQFANEVMMKYPDEEVYKKYYNDLIGEVSDSVNLSELKQVYHYVGGYYYYSTQQFSKALIEFDLAYNENKRDINTQNMIHDVIIKFINPEADPELLIDTLDVYFDKYHFIANNKQLQNIYTYCHFDLVGTALDDDNDDEILEYLELLNEDFAKYDTLYYEVKYVEYIYEDAYFYFMDEGKKTLAKKYLQEGIELAPNSKVLKDLNERPYVSSSNYKEVVLYTPKSPEDEAKEFMESFETAFVGCWKATKKYNSGSDDKKSKYSGDKKITVVKFKKINYNVGSKEVSGKWSMRPRIKLLYLTPDNSSSNYIIYKIKYVSKDEIHLQVYVDKKKTKTVLVFEPCK